MADKDIGKIGNASSPQDAEVTAETVGNPDGLPANSAMTNDRTYEELLALAQRVRGSGKADWLTPEFIRAAREHGRE
jgi:hypothetical protein